MMVEPMILGFPTSTASCAISPAWRTRIRPSRALRVSAAAAAGQAVPHVRRGRDHIPQSWRTLQLFPKSAGASRTKRASLANAQRTMPWPAGGMTIDHVPEILDFHGPDTMLLIGGGLLQPATGSPRRPSRCRRGSPGIRKPPIPEDLEHPAAEDGSRWGGVELLAYRTRAARRSGRSPGGCCSAAGAWLRAALFRRCGRRASTLERHQHVHAVVIFRDAAPASSGRRCAKWVRRTLCSFRR